MSESTEEPGRIEAPASCFPPWVILAGCLFFYVAVVGFVIPSGAKYHGDERFYTDAAMRMCDTGDYWTPYYPNGKIRLLKPIMTYLGVAGSFKAFGVSLLSSRLPSLLAGALSIAATFFLGRTVLKSARLGAFSALLLTSNIEFLTLSARATPDAQVTLWTLVSLLGFAKVWFDEKPSLAGPMLAWVGMGLAVQTKGLLGLCPLAANAVFLWFAPRGSLSSRPRQLLDWRALVPGVAIALSWYLLMVRMHGAGALRDFFDDQVGAKVSLSPGFMLHNLFTYALAGVRHFMPWTLLVVVGLFFARDRLRAFWKERRAACIFLLALFPLLVIAFSFGNMRTSRYVMVSYPGLAVFLAGALDAWWAHAGLQRLLRNLIPVLSALLFVMGAVLIWLGFNYGWRPGAAGVLMVVLAATGFAARREPGHLDARWCWLAALPMVFYGAFDGGIRPLSTPTPFPAIAKALVENRASGDAVFTWQVEETAASQVRLAVHNTVAVRQLTRSNSTEAVRLVLTTAAGKEKLSADDFDFKPVSMDEDAVKVRNALRPYRRTDRGRNTAGRNTEYWLAIAKPAEGAGQRQ